MIDASTTVIGLIGYPLGHSLSPLMHNQTIEQMGLNFVYLPFEVTPDRLREALAAIPALNIRGVNVTIPYKEKIIKHLDELSSPALACGAVNLIKNEGGRLIGYNTDGQGFLASLREAGIVLPDRALFIGAGGAARAVANELSQQGVSHMDLLDIDENRALELANFLSQRGSTRATAAAMSEERFARLSARAGLIINCTPVGMFPQVDSSPVSSLQYAAAGAVIYDLVYNPQETKFLLMGKELGHRTLSGLSMLVHQGALTLEILTGVKPPIKYMMKVVKNYYQ